MTFLYKYKTFSIIAGITLVLSSCSTYRQHGNGITLGAQKLEARQAFVQTCQPNTEVNQFAQIETKNPAGAITAKTVTAEKQVQTAEAGTTVLNVTLHRKIFTEVLRKANAVQVFQKNDLSIKLDGNPGENNTAKTEKLGVWSFVLSILTAIVYFIFIAHALTLLGLLLIALAIAAAIILGAKSFNRIDHYPDKYKGKGFGTAGIVIALVLVAVLLVALI